jgi:hypothetical protein
MANAQNTGRGLKVLGIKPHFLCLGSDCKALQIGTVSKLARMVATPGMDNGKRANVMFGPEPGKGGSFIVVRNATTPATPRPPSQAVVDHICFTIPNWDDAKVVAAFKEV